MPTNANGFTIPSLWGIINATPDSFSDGGKYESTERAIDHGLRLVRDGANVLDVGGESTRPGARPVSPAEEIDRVCPVVVGLLEAGVTRPISVDTRHCDVAKAALDAGASIINDVSAGADRGMFETVASAKASMVLMHMRGIPETMQDDPRYDDVVNEIGDALHERAGLAVAAGIKRERLWIDPGIGFGKTIAHNVTLLRELESLMARGLRVLIGTSRKSFLGQLVGGRPTHERLAGTLATLARAYDAGVQAVRIHDVRAAHDFLVTYDALTSAKAAADNT